MSFSALIVDDDWDTGQILKICLEQSGYQVSVLQNSRAALEALQAQVFDLITLDLSMPEISGLELLQIIQKDTRHQKAVVILITATPHMVADGTTERADYIMNKPLNLEQFIRFLNRLQASSS